MKRILVVNRGEIARRIIKSINKIGAHAVGLKLSSDYSPYYLEEAPEVLTYNTDSPREAFLSPTNTIQLARENKIDLIHPGYGFLSESSEFAKLAELSGIKYIGPSSETLNVLGDKVRAKELAESLQVPIISGTRIEKEDLKSGNLDSKIGTLKFPLIIKAGAGGGGRGMRIVKSKQELIDLLPGAQNEALRSFGSEEVFLETFLTKVRHIEVQVIGDSIGNLIHLFERDCSIQRKFQKVIEIAPAPLLDKSLAKSLYADSLKLAKAAKLTNAATFEFLVDTKNNTYYFIESNPRIQVEHCITEEITGIDIVALQIKSALGETIPEQTKIKKKGFSIQTRLCAEIPEEDFSPSTGKIRSWLIPQLESSNKLRIESGYKISDEIGTNYDSLITKIISSGATFKEAQEALLQTGLSIAEPEGIKTNAAFLHHILDRLSKPETIYTRWLEDAVLADYATSRAQDTEIILLYASLIEKIALSTFSKNNIFSSSVLRTSFLSNYTLNLHIQGKTFTLNSDPPQVDYNLTEGIGTFSIEIKKHHFYLQKDSGPSLVRGFFKGIPFTISRVEKIDRGMEEALDLSDCDLRAPLPGEIVKISCQKGQSLMEGVEVISIESMKTEHKLFTVKDVIVDDIMVGVGDKVEKGDLLVKCTKIKSK